MISHNKSCYHYSALTSVVTLLLVYMNCASTMDVKPQKELYTPDYRVYHNLSSIGLTLDKLAKENPSFIKYHPEYVSRHGRSQHLIRVTNFTNIHSVKHSDLERVKVLFSFGEHAREFLPIETLFFLIKNLVKTQDISVINSTSNINLDELDIYIIVLGNPDGRQYVEQKKNLCWRGTSTGVDMNRNFDWEFGGKGSSSNQKDEEYRGTRAFSEPECTVYTDLTEKVQFDAFLSLHSGIRQIYVPFADTKSRQTGREPENLEEMLTLAKLLATSTKNTYEYGKAASLNEYTADGTLFDYMAGVRKIPFSYAIELWGPDNYRGSSCFNLFNPPNDKLQTVVEEIYPLYSTLLDYLIKWKKRSLTLDDSNKTGLKDSYQPLQDGNKTGIRHSVYVNSVHSMSSMEEGKQAEVPSLTPGFILLCFVVMVTILVAIHGKYPVCRRMFHRRRVVSLRSLGSTFSTNLFNR